MTDTKNPPKTQSKRFVTNKFLQQKLGVSAKTIRRWATQMDWQILKINDRVIRFNAEDVENSVGVDLS